VVVHRNTPYEAINKNRKIGVVCVRSQYEIKIYDKGLACGVAYDNIIRIEYKVFKMQALAGLGITKLIDLCNPERFPPLVDLLISALNDTVFIPPDTILDLLTIRNKALFML
jgi:hypothetical protein